MALGQINKYGFLGIPTKAGDQLKRAEKAAQAAERKPMQLGMSQAQQATQTGMATEQMQKDIQAQQEALAASALGGTAVQAGALQQAATGLGATLAEGTAQASAQTQAMNQQMIQQKREEARQRLAEAKAEKEASDEKIIGYIGTGLKVAGAIIGGPVAATALAIGDQAGKISKGETVTDPYNTQNMGIYGMIKGKGGE